MCHQIALPKTMLFQVITLALCLSYSSAAISSSCLHCICEVESNCSPLACRMDVGSLSCGYYQIKSPYYSDCHSPGSGWQSCSTSKSCADTCVRNYMERYGRHCTGGRTPTCEDYARIHNGGPGGCKNSNTLGYWSKVHACLNRGKK